MILKFCVFSIVTTLCSRSDIVWKLNEDGLKYIFRETDCQHLAAASVIYNMGWEKVRC